MKTKTYLLILSCLISVYGLAQSVEKIKGNKNVTTLITEINTFNRLVIGDDFKINLKQGKTPSVKIVTDDNLHEVVEFKVINGSLNFIKSKRITSRKKMEITVIFSDSLNIIELKEDAELTSSNTIKLNHLILRAKESSEAYLTVEAETFQYIGTGKTKAELNISTNIDVTIDLSDNSNLKAVIGALDIKINMLQRAYAKIEGHSKSLTVSTDNSTVLKANKLATNSCVLITEGRADVHVKVKENLIIEGSGTTETYIYGNPKMELVRFEDEAILRKKIMSKQ
ncbi:GIN domain-containing protein [Lacinutrix jangbogonensis]|uniref:GIN domain-containing protein n=1 Tax=Lacinutrix jangbogonensis TaxID=1469557 RepID=UPI00053D46F4|nr:DUF2807 domain-containing protein [Lacinutrix jangbogonensis]